MQDIDEELWKAAAVIYPKGPTTKTPNSRIVTKVTEFVRYNSRDFGEARKIFYGR